MPKPRREHTQKNQVRKAQRQSKLLVMKILEEVAPFVIQMQRMQLELRFGCKKVRQEDFITTSTIAQYGLNNLRFAQEQARAFAYDLNLDVDAFISSCRSEALKQILNEQASVEEPISGDNTMSDMTADEPDEMPSKPKPKPKRKPKGVRGKKGKGRGALKRLAELKAKQRAEAGEPDNETADIQPRAEPKPAPPSRKWTTGDGKLKPRADAVVDVEPEREPEPDAVSDAEEDPQVANAESEEE